VVLLATITLLTVAGSIKSGGHVDVAHVSSGTVTVVFATQAGLQGTTVTVASQAATVEGLLGTIGTEYTPGP
jgi:hypothetical protein